MMPLGDNAMAHPLQLHTDQQEVRPMNPATVYVLSYAVLLVVFFVTTLVLTFRQEKEAGPLGWNGRNINAEANPMGYFPSTEHPATEYPYESYGDTFADEEEFTRRESA